MADTSLSRRTGDYRAQLAFAEAFLSELDGDDRFVCIPFDVKPRLPQNGFSSGPRARAKALADLKAIIPMGATNLEAVFDGVIDYLARQPSRERLEIVFLGDGIATLGETTVEKLAPKIAAVLRHCKARFHAVLVGNEHDRTLAAEVARGSGGLLRFLTPGDNVVGEAFRLALALDSTLVAAPNVLFAGTETYDVYAKQNGTMIAGDEFILVGRYKHKEKLSVTVKEADGTVRNAEFRLPPIEQGDFFIPDFWARERLHALLLKEQTPEVHTEIIALSQKYSLITPYTSWLVLETEEDYRRYGINRLMRRRYWEVLGGIKTNAPPEELNTGPKPLVTQPAPTKSVNEKEKQAEPPPKPLTLADVDLSLLRERNESEVASALSTLCLEVYYRYLPMYRGSVNTVNINPVAPLPNVKFDVLDASSVGRQFSDKSERWLKDDPRKQSENLKFPSLPHFTTRTNTGASNDEDSISDVPLGGRGTVSSIGIGGGRVGAFSFRGGGGRRYLVRTGGGSPASESAVDAGVRWLARQQGSDGSWSNGAGEETSLAILSFLGSGQSERVGRYKNVVRSGIQWLINRQKNDGQIGEGLLNHCLATMTLAEAAGMGRMQETRMAAQKAVEWLEQQQNMSAGKRQGFGTGLTPSRSKKNSAADLTSAKNGDPFVSAWAAFALKSARVAGLKINIEVLEGLAAYLSGVQGDNGAVGLCGKPHDNEIHLLHTACVSTARTYLGDDFTDVRLVRAVQILEKMVMESKEMTDDGLYLRYFTNLLMFRAGGESWSRWNAWLKNELLNSRFGGESCWPAAGIWHRYRPKPIQADDLAGQLAGVIAFFLRNDANANAYENAAAALSRISDTDLLRSMLNGAEQLPPVCKDLICLRRGLILLQKNKRQEALAEVRAVYERNKEADNVLVVFAQLLQQMNRHDELLDNLMKEIAAGPNTHSHSALAADLLFRPEVAVPDPVEYVERRLNRHVGKHSDFIWKAAQVAQAKGNFKVAAHFFEKVYEECGRPEELRESYINALILNKEFNKAANELETVLQVGNHTPWVFNNLAVCYDATHRSNHELLRAYTNQLELFPKDEWVKTELARTLIAKESPTALSYLLETELFDAERFNLADQIVRRSIAQNDDETLLKTLEAMFAFFQKTGKSWPGGFWVSTDILKKTAIIKALEKKPELKCWLNEYLRFDLAVEMTWDTQNTDVELLVEKPSGEKSSSARPHDHGDRWLIRNDGGKTTKTFLLYRATPGRYVFAVDYRVGTWPTNVKLKIFRDLGGLNETIKEIQVTLKKRGEQALAEELTVSATQAETEQSPKKERASAMK